MTYKSKLFLWSLSLGLILNIFMAVLIKGHTCPASSNPAIGQCVNIYSNGWPFPLVYSETALSVDTSFSWPAFFLDWFFWSVSVLVVIIISKKFYKRNEI